MLDIAPTPPTPLPLRRESRAALRSVEAGNYVDCSHCGERVKFQAKLRKQQVICNVYVDGRWNRVEHYHAECYEEAGQPHGATEYQEARTKGRYEKAS
jgi:hypothetical protein